MENYAQLEDARLAALHCLGVLDTEPELEFDAIVKAAASLCGAPISLLSLVDKDRLWVKASVGLDSVREVNRSVSFCTITIEQSEILEIPDTHKDERFADNVLVSGEPRIRFYAGIALRLSDNHRVGTLSVIDIKPRKLTPAMRDTLVHLARLVAHLLESRRNARALTISESRFRTLCESSPLGIFAADAEDGITYVNNRLLQIFGISDANCAVDGWQLALHPETRETVVDEWQRLVKARQEFDREFRVQHPNGEFVTVRVISRPLDNDAQSLSGYVGTVEDISERKVQRDLQRRTSRLLQQTGDMAHVGGWEYDLHSKQLIWTEQTRLIHGVSCDYRPQIDKVLKMYSRDSQSLIREAVECAVRDGVAWDVEAELNRPDGRSIWVRMVGKLGMCNGKATRLCGAVQDIDAQVRQRYALENAHERMSIATDSGQIGIWEYDIQSESLKWTPQMFKLYGLSDTGIQPSIELWAACLHKEDKADTIKALTQAISQGKNLEREYRIVWPDGSVRYIRSTAHLKHDIKNRAPIMLGVNWDVTEIRRSTQDMIYRATHDELTAMLNRTEFEARVQQSIECINLQSGVQALMFIDLDQFKIVNDACGHAAGNQLLKQVSSLLEQTVPDDSILARLGGDEFGILVTSDSVGHVRNIARKICDRMDDYRFSHSGRRFRIGASIGLVQVESRWTNMSALIQAADSACYAAKDEGRNRVHVWCDTDTAMTIRMGDMQWAARLEQSLDDEQFELYAQQLSSLKGVNRGLNAELLIRLKDISGKLIQPSAFLPAAERFHLATRIDRWVLQATIELLEKQHDLSTIEKFWINLSGQSVGDREFHRDALAMLENAGDDICTRLCIEITETAAVTNIASASYFIGQLRDLGIDTALDDFGAGASSFAYLKTLPVDILKIDGQFITNLGDDPLDEAAVRCFADVARVVGLKTVAEHVDDNNVLNCVRSMGIDYAQGYKLHKPEPVCDLLCRQSIESRDISNYGKQLAEVG